jgi:DSF synthase
MISAYSGVAEVLAEPGEGRAAVEAFMQEGRRNFPVRNALARARERIAPVTLDELRDVTDPWVENALQLAPADLRRIALLRAAQMRRLAAG